ncbi:3',5'-nucleoside bisphosphate phosphatase [Azoarcus sp. KH32C]|uniref:3',5'-nucleoside bisphosphate phosphatase n=1 Tax=Azoarcus sp. KH32C TaxID=748247 RepID=UPI000238613C|nr:3',5'-nucleoside bisphosphate phosphatase [Azoarcus sp. KH32C]BAL24551.1 phosphotransferase domain-containing protein [Azoarcus sp. KH32C]
MQINADLHCHSTVSDGWLTPTDVVRRAAANSVALLALTDHDEVGGIDEACGEALRLGVRLLPGVEISVTFLKETVHVVGLGIDHRDRQLLEGLESVRSGRVQRARKMSAALDAAGIHGTFEGASRLARNPAMVGRAHFARYIVSTGLMPDVSTVFQYYLARGKPGYVEHEWASLDDAVRWIRGAGGVAVLAHPARYRLSTDELHRLLDRFVACGGEGIEVVAGAHTEAETVKFAAIARRWGLLASRASDFHGEGESSVDLGRSSNLPPDLTPVWTRFV